MNTEYTVSAIIALLLLGYLMYALLAHNRNAVHGTQPT